MFKLSTTTFFYKRQIKNTSTVALLPLKVLLIFLFLLCGYVGCTFAFTVHQFLNWSVSSSSALRNSRNGSTSAFSCNFTVKKNK